MAEKTIYGKQTLIIRPNGDVKNPMLVNAYWDTIKKKTMCLDMNYRVHPDNFPANVVRFSYTFNERISPELKIEWDWSENHPNQIDITNQRHAKDWFMNHTNIDVVGHKNPNLTRALFTMFVLEDMEDIEHKAFELKLRIMNIVYNMNADKRRDLAYFFGTNPSVLSDKQVLLSLVGNNGVLLIEDNSRELLRIMSLPENKEMLVRTVVKKAITIGKIVKRDGKYYGYGDDELIGVSEEDVFKFYFSNAKMYEFLVKEVGVSDFSSEKMFVPKTEAKAELSEKDLRSKASSLGIKGFYNMDLDKLKEAIAIKESE